MTGISRLIGIILAASPLLTAALWMDTQPTYKPYRSPALPTPAGSVPVSGREGTGKAAGMLNPPPSDANTLALGQTLFGINCAMCHGPEGRPVAGSAVVALAGKRADAFVAAMNGFREG